jgi:hypothetical protein
MARIALLSLSLTLASSLFAQGPGGPGNPPPINGRTATDFAVFAQDGTTVAFDAVASQTAIPPGIGIHAVLGGGPNLPPALGAHSSVMPMAATMGAGLRVVESGRIHGTDPNANYAIGTSQDAPNTTAPVQGRHAVALHFAVAQGGTGVVSIGWTGNASPGASALGAVDVDGDGVPDWTGAAGTNNQTNLPVTAGANGITLAIATNAGATVAGVGNAGYDCSLTVLFRPTGGGTNPVTVTWTATGPQCLGSLSGTDTQANGVLTLNLAVAGAPANGFGILLGGAPATSPVPLPFGACQLLIDPAGRGGGMRSFVTDANGAATFVYRVRAIAFTIDFQAVTFGFGPNNTSLLGSTNALNMTAQ